MRVMRWAQKQLQRKKKRRWNEEEKESLFSHSAPSFASSSLISYEEGELEEGGGLSLLTLLCGDMSGPDWRNVV